MLRLMLGERLDEIDCEGLTLGLILNEILSLNDGLKLGDNEEDKLSLNEGLMLKEILGDKLGLIDREGDCEGLMLSETEGLKL